MTTNLLTLSHATYLGPSGATAAATYQFVSKGYEQPAEPRDIETDIVHNQNGRFKYVYDSGPGFRRWKSFDIACQSQFQALVGANAATQYARLLEMWNHKGTLGIAIAGATYTVHWAEQTESAFVIFPRDSGDTIERDVSVQFEEA